MKRVEKIAAAARDPRAVPLMVPHGGAEAGRDFESAFDLLRCDERVRQLWHRERAKTFAGAGVLSPRSGELFL